MQIPDTPGNLSIRIWTKQEEGCCHFWTVTEWIDIDAVRAFAGKDLEKAVYYPEDEGVLLEFEEHVTHYHSYDVPRDK